jgi:hypothetical protein
MYKSLLSDPMPEPGAGAEIHSGFGQKFRLLALRLCNTAFFFNIKKHFLNVKKSFNIQYRYKLGQFLNKQCRIRNARDVGVYKRRKEGKGEG